MNNIASPRTDDVGIEQQIQAKGKTSPRVTPARIKEVISSVHYFTAAQGTAHTEASSSVDVHSTGVPSLGYLTFCVLVLRNGFTVTGESSCASPENFDAGIGRSIAYGNAVDKIWPLEGYLLKQALYEGAVA